MTYSLTFSAEKRGEGTGRVAVIKIIGFSLFFLKKYILNITANLLAYCEIHFPEPLNLMQ